MRCEVSGGVGCCSEGKFPAGFQGIHRWLRNSGLATMTHAQLSTRLGAGWHLLLYREPAGAATQASARGEHRSPAGCFPRCTAGAAVRCDRHGRVAGASALPMAFTEGDADNASRWARIKSGFSRRLPPTERRSDVRIRKRERGIWQRRFWEHMILDEDDLRNHIDYIHFNPVKHGYVRRAVDWPYSSLHRCIASGLLPIDWACDAVMNIRRA